ncbi:MAG: sigma-54 dependent transcriptional regulator [bacterium]|nr:sigma-54 dependent transcriptional regulator [bacterium]
MKYSVLVVDDDNLVNEFLVEALQRTGFECKAAYSGEEALIAFQQSSFDIVLTDLKMKAMDGLTLIGKLRKINPKAVIIMMTAYGTIETAVNAIKIGAHDFLLKPVLPETLDHIMNRVTEMIELRQENAILKRDVADRFQNMIGSSRAMTNLFDLVQAVAPARSTIMITGGSGTGKEMVARAIHYSSNRAEGPFVKLNCAAIPESLVEAELFGYEKGAFTDAKKTNRGRFELADGGTLLLDEISEMPMNLQSKLLRVIQEREFERIGSSSTIKIDVRIIATSNRNLKEHIARGEFREDLFFRLNVIPVHLPALEDRKDDIPLLVDHFIDKYNSENGKAVEGIEQSAMSMLMKYHWPGNVRELENLIERAVVTTTGESITEDDFPIELALGRFGDDLPLLKVPMKLEEGSKYLILKTLEKFNGNKTKAAEALGITTRTIRNKLAEYSTGEVESA